METPMWADRYFYDGARYFRRMIHQRPRGDATTNVARR